MKISVAMATYNGARYLPEQLASIAAQDRAPDELVISDDGSSDNTLNIISSFQAPFPVRIMTNKQRLGQGGNISRALAAVEGDLIFITDQDDRWHPNRISFTLQSLHEADLIASDLVIVDEQGRATGERQWQRLGLCPDEIQMDPVSELIRRNVITGAATAVTRRLLERALPVPQGWLADEWLALVAAGTGQITFLDEPLVDYRQHDSQQIGGAVHGILAQWRQAKAAMGREYLEEQAVRCELGAHRLEAVAPEVSAALSAKQQHFERRARMPQPRWRRLDVIVPEWRRGAYNKFAYGWRSAAQDFFIV